MTESYLQDILLPSMEAEFLERMQWPVPVETAAGEIRLSMPLQEAILCCVQLLSRQGRLIDAPEEAPQPAICTFVSGKLSSCLLVCSVEQTDVTEVRVTVCAAAGILPRPGLARRKADEVIKSLILENRKEKRA